MIFNLPTISKLFSNSKRDSDSRGEILSIVDAKIQNVSIITSNANIIRSNHYHKKDFHFMYVLEGKIDYFYKTINDDTVNYIEVLKGNNIFTPNLEIHATYFPVPTKLIVSSGFPRDQKTYEKDTVRVDFLNKDNIKEFLKKYAIK
jgi:hypothetical protein